MGSKLRSETSKIGHKKLELFPVKWISKEVSYDNMTDPSYWATVQ